MKILVTGADGFIGSHLSEKLFDLGHDIRALSQYNSLNNWGWLEDVHCKDSIEIISGDIRDQTFCTNLCKDVDIVFHLAALIGIPYSYAAPDSYIDTNIIGTVNICHAAINNNVKQVVHTSTSEVYGTAQYVPIDEGHPMQPQSPYSASKIAADSMAMSFYNAFDLPLSIIRPFNTYGPRQSGRAVIPNIISQIASGEKNIKLGDVTPTRDFNYVEDTCDGFISLINNEQSIGETFNVGSNSEISIEETFNIIREIMNADVKIVSDSKRIRPKKSEVHRLFCDATKIKKVTEYSPKYSLHEGLKKTIEWFTKAENLKLYKHNIYNV